MKETATIDIVLPLPEHRKRVIAIIDEELARGHTNEASRVELMRLIVSMKGMGAQGVAVTSPDLARLAKDEDAPIPIFDAARLHVRRVVAWVLPTEEKTRGCYLEE